jgi:hypothetical protein
MYLASGFMIRLKSKLPRPMHGRFDMRERNGKATPTTRNTNAKVATTQSLGRSCSGQACYPSPSPFSGYLLAAARLAAHIFLVTAMIAALQAALSFRFGFGAAFEAGLAIGVADACGSGIPFTVARRLRCASAMALRPAAPIFRRGGFVDTGVAVDSAGMSSSEPGATLGQKGPAAS